MLCSCHFLPPVHNTDTCISQSMDRNVLEWVDHLHEHFVDPAQLSGDGRYIAPTKPGYSMEMLVSFGLLKGRS